MGFLGNGLWLLARVLGNPTGTGQGKMKPPQLVLLNVSVMLGCVDWRQDSQAAVEFMSQILLGSHRYPVKHVN